MAVIHVPRPPASAWNPNRKASSLLRTQVEHMHLAEKRLPQRYRTDIYVNAIRTEGEAAEYIGQVTAAILRAHQDAAKKRARAAARPGQLLQIAAEAEDTKGSKARKAAARGKSSIARGKGSAARAKGKARKNK